MNHFLKSVFVGLLALELTFEQFRTDIIMNFTEAKRHLHALLLELVLCGIFALLQPGTTSSY